MPFKDRAQHREYCRQWMRHRRARFFADKQCEHCRSTQQLELHHDDPNEKTSHRIWSWSAARRAAETAKCQVLCKTCHRILTNVYLRECFRGINNNRYPFAYRGPDGRFCRRLPTAA